MNAIKINIKHHKTGMKFFRRFYNTPLSPNKIEQTIVVHGGASNFEDNLRRAKITGVKDAARKGFAALLESGDPIHACEQAIRFMETVDVFNAGFGCVLNENGHVEMDACMMSGADMSAGGIAAVKDVLHPISVAKKVMEKCPHIVLAGEGAYLYAKNMGMELAMPGGLVTKRARRRYTDNTIYDQKELGAVGAVSVSAAGRTAAGISSGGVNRKKQGRVGPASRPGAGVYADDLVGAVAATGHGESVATRCLASVLLQAVRAGAAPADALVAELKLMRDKLQNNGGAIMVTKHGEPAIYYTTKRMPYAIAKAGMLTYGGIDKNDEKSENL